MKPSSKRLLSIVALLAVALVTTVLLRRPVLSDQDQILAQMQSAAAAAEHHDVGAIMKIVSAHYHGSTGFDSNVDQLNFFLRRIARNQGTATVTLGTPGVQVHGDTADSVGQVTVRPSDGGQPYYDQPVTLHWKREDGTKWLVFPAKVWRVVGAEYPAPGLGDEGGGLL